MAKSKKKKRFSKTKKKKKVVKKKVKKKKPKKKPKKRKSKKSKVSALGSPLEAPPEFEEIHLPTFVEVENTLRKEFQTARSKVSIDTQEPQVYAYSPVPMRDYLGEIHGEWRADVLRGETTSEVLQEMMEALDWPVLGYGYWITVGLRFHGKSEFDERTGQWSHIDEEEQHYNKDQGMLDVSSNYRPMIRKARVLSSFNAILEGSSRNPTPMWRSVEKKFKRKVSQVYVRIIWNPENKQPKRNIE